MAAATVHQAPGRSPRSHRRRAAGRRHAIRRRSIGKTRRGSGERTPSLQVEHGWTDRIEGVELGGRHQLQAGHPRQGKRPCQ